MPSAVLRRGAPLHDLPVFWKNRAGAARTERLAVHMFTFACSSIASEEGTLRGGRNFKESTHSISFFLQIHVRAEWEGKAWFHSSLTSPSGRVHICVKASFKCHRCWKQYSTRAPIRMNMDCFAWLRSPPARSHWSHRSDRKSSQVAQQMRWSIGPSDWNISALSNDFPWTGSGMC